MELALSYPKKVLRNPPFLYSTLSQELLSKTKYYKVEKLPALAGIPAKLWVFCLTKWWVFLKRGGIFKENPKVHAKNWWPVPNLASRNEAISETWYTRQKKIGDINYDALDCSPLVNLLNLTGILEPALTLDFSVEVPFEAMENIYHFHICLLIRRVWKEQ